MLLNPPADAIITASKRSPRQHRIAVTIYFFISGFGYASWASRIPTIQQQLHLNEAELGLALFALPVGLLVTMPFTRWFLRTISSRKIMFLGSFFFIVVLSLPGFINRMWQLVAVLFCFGSARNLLNLSMNALAVDTQALHQKSIMTTFHGVWSLAGFAGAAVGYVMVSVHVAPSYHLLGVSIILFMLSLFFYRDSLHLDPKPEKKRKIFTLPGKPVLLFSLICFGSMACENTMYDWGSIYFKKIFLTSGASATAAFVVYMIAMTSGRFIGDSLTGRLGIPRLLTFSGMLIFAGLTLAVVTHSPLVAGFGFVLVGLGVSCIVPLVFSFAGKFKHINSGTALASISTIGYLGFLVIPPFIGLLAQATSLRWSFAFIALFGAMISFLATRIGNSP